MTTTTTVSSSCFSVARTAFLCVMAALAMLASQATSAATIGSFVYGIDEAGDLYEVNAADKTSTYITSLSPNTATNALGYDSSRNQLFFVDNDLNFQVWDRSSSSTTNLGNALGIAANPANADYYDNAFWYFETNSTDLKKANLTYSGSTPSVSSVDTFPIAGMAATGVNTNTFGDIAIDPTSGTLYASTSRGRFYSIDLASPSTTFQQLAASLGNDRSVGLQLSFSENGSVLYGHRYADGSWYTVDTSTGGLTDITGFVTTPAGGVGFRDLGGAAAVPEPSTMLLAGMGIAGAVVHQVRRRKKLAV
jgi:hypothetical protein